MTRADYVTVQGHWERNRRHDQPDGQGWYYDTAKLEAILNALVHECSDLAATIAAEEEGTVIDD
jgi:hypothetical protein